MALLPPSWLDTVVAIGHGDNASSRTWIGSGFIYAQIVKADENGAKNGRIWLVTNKHVLDGIGTIYLKFNSKEGLGSKDYKVDMKNSAGELNWVGHPREDVDVAAMFLNNDLLVADGRHFKGFSSDSDLMCRSDMKSTQITEGDRIFALGFPLNMVIPQRMYAICRSGALARVRDFIEGVSDNFIGDVMVFPVNSGGPVVLCPSAMAITGTQTIKAAKLIGIVKSYIPYRDVAVSVQTKRPRIELEENSGLTMIESADSIIETVELANQKRLDQLEAIRVAAQPPPG